MKKIIILCLILISCGFIGYKVFAASTNNSSNSYADGIKKLEEARKNAMKPARITVANTDGYKIGHIGSKTIKYIPRDGYVVDGTLKAKNIVNSLNNVCASAGFNMYPATPEILEDLLKNHYEELHKMGAAPAANQMTGYFSIGSNGHLYSTQTNPQAKKYNLPSYISHTDINNIAFTIASQLPTLCISVSK